MADTPAPSTHAALGFLLDDAARLFRREFDARARAHGITALQWRLLMQLRRNGPERQGKLADLIEVEPITLSRMIDRLVDAGFVVRVRDPLDRRSHQLAMTDRVEALVTAVEPLVAELLRDAMNGIGAADAAALRMLLSRMQANLSAARSEPAFPPALHHSGGQKGPSRTRSPDPADEAT